METFFWKECKVSISFYKAFYGKQNKYWIINIDKSIKGLEYINNCIENLIEKFSYKVVASYRKDYIEKLKQVDLKIDFYNSELLYYLAYGISICGYSEYIRMNDIVANEEILIEIFFRINIIKAVIVEFIH